MEPKAFDLQELGKNLLGCAKSAAVPATGVVLDWASKGCLASSSNIVKGIGGVIVAVKPQILAEVEKAIK